MSNISFIFKFIMEQMNKENIFKKYLQKYLICTFVRSI